MWYKNVGTNLFRFVTKHAFDKQTDAQAERQTESLENTLRSLHAVAR